MESRTGRAVSRRQFIATGAALAGAAALTLANTECTPAIRRRLAQAPTALPLRHGVWVWQFTDEGHANDIAAKLGQLGLAAIVKTHDGTDWMSTYDRVPGAIDGPGGVATMAAVFEQYGVPLHAWAVVKGIDPAREAAMAADVLDAGARSITLDLESYDGFWAGRPQDALLFGEELRARNQDGRVDVAIDPRPWRMLEVPLGEFAAFCDGIRPQLYWDILNTPDNVSAYTYMGFEPPEGAITPEFMVESSAALLAPFDRWIVPIALGSPHDPSAWARFQSAAWEHQMHAVNVWRYTTTSPAVFEYLGAYPAGAEPG